MPTLHFLLLCISQVEKAGYSSVGSGSPPQHRQRGRCPPGMTWSCAAVAPEKLGHHRASSQQPWGQLLTWTSAGSSPQQGGRIEFVFALGVYLTQQLKETMSATYFAEERRKCETEM